MISTKKHIQQLAAILRAKGTADVVISPGSRSGPLTHTFVSSGYFTCCSVVDERSAGYFAIGLAQAKQKPVVLVCSSGTASLNYAPAVAEAYYQNIPLIVLTADRPDYWIDQGENQTIRQHHIYRDFCKKEITLPMGESEKELWFAGRMMNETLNTAVSGAPGPVHINIPLEEPLHDLMDEDLPPVKIIEVTDTETFLPESEQEKLAAVFNKAEKILILAGQQNHNPGLEKILAGLVKRTGAVVLKEHLANLNNPHFCSHVDILMTSLLSENSVDFQPDLLISFGGAFVSKPLKQFLRKNRPEHHWHLSEAGQYYDTYQSLTRVINMKTATFFGQLSELSVPMNRDFFQRWKEKEQQVSQMRDTFILETNFCDLKVFDFIRKSIPENSVLHLGNSSPVRYALLCDASKEVEYFGNRGTSGIDGSLSTAVGFACESKKINTVILGDLAFFYDSNALWNKYIGVNLRIVVIHNGGGNIFSMIKGPGESPAFKEYFFTENKYSAAGIANTFGIDYFKAENETELEEALQKFYAPEQKKAAILEIFTEADENSRAFRELFKYVKTK
ncbi:2-succinyl-5-enolpyruvyl-6-hydroxy-3-cyclohexene-1-carboxylic-acid synthase [Mariniphaga sediminis]|uniref:2-succinyl-5-enolpyruvyl-6-hydroxy-3-cyclohexene-1-carboxylate synthase n=1 Tax=Mariniphaga sediminis TaxID=1628158 RepID=A0A399CV76_9BACT|nr:2-succinyl-5-enolpyruvyl-6-hydroxy-3-cyclohexene-1-carboxylic-acid synthase [Mariniphaga sediminis]RIH63347.1 2-succinyl-5-enolpyruvyl-6-hydroxy-3-cyclohexene-1-carboxylic-acid synthase [Mariniphaga sediminis]